MLTPVDITNRVFKGGIGYDKKDVETFMAEFSADYRELYSSNVELNDKIATLNESLLHYRSIEDSMQKALTLSEKTAEETISAANDKARQINIEAELKAESLLEDARKELQTIKDEIYRYRQMFSQFKAQFSKILEAQQKALEVEVLDVELGSDFEPSANVLHSFYGLGMSYSDGSMGGGLGSGIGFGTYVGANDPMRERTNQDPAFDRGSLNMDPFADAANGGGRFSKQTGGAYNGGKKKSSKNSNGKNKTSLNVKDTKSSKVKRHVTAQNIKPVSEKNVTSAINTTPIESVVNNTATQTVTKEDILNAINASQTAATNTTTTSNTNVDINTGAFTVPTPNVTSDMNATTYIAAANSTVNENATTYAATQNTTANVNATTYTATQNTTANVNTTAYTATPNATADINTTAYTATPNTNTATYTAMSNTTPDVSAAMYETKPNVVADANNSSFATEDTDSDALNGEVESKQMNSRMLDSEDNYSEGFDFIAESTTTQFSYNPDSEVESDTYVGEVENRIKESNMINSNDDYNEGFNFIVDDLEEVEIPTIFPTADMNAFNNNLNNMNNADEDVLVGSVEDKLNKSSLIGNDDDNDDGFKFL